MIRAANLLPEAIARLRQAGVDDPVRDARRLLAFALGLPADRMTLHLGDEVDPAGIARFDAAVAARARRQPLSQITGRRLFWGRKFRVTRDTLDPRPETEILVEKALSAPFSRVLDLGTGTGAILLTLLAERVGASGLGVDLSPAAVAVAAENATALGIADRAEIVVSDWFCAVHGRFDLILSNPPYITHAEMAGLQPEVHDWEPHLALTPGGDGLAAYRAIAAGLGAYLSPGGRVLLETGPEQGDAVAGLLSGAGLADIAVLSDLDGRPRVVSARAAN